MEAILESAGRPAKPVEYRAAEALDRAFEDFNLARAWDRINRIRDPLDRELSGAFMSLSLVEALGQVDLESGRVYVCQVKGHWVELRVLRTAEVPTLAAYDESDVMLDPWVECPQPTPKFSVIAEFGPAPLPDVPEIPDDEDGA